MYISLKTEAAAASIYVSSAAVAIFSKKNSLGLLAKQAVSECDEHNSGPQNTF